MVELWIDGHMCDIDHMPKLPINFDVSRLTDVEGAREGRNIELTLPATPANNALFEASCDAHTSRRFNTEHHTARIEKDGIKIFDGTAYLLEAKMNDGAIDSYKIGISEGGAEWIDGVVSGELSDLEIPFSGELNLSTISSSWQGEQAVRFLPVYRGNYLRHYSSTTSLPVERMLLTDDYHPFISVAEMVKEMFAKSGYKLRSRFLDGELGRSLYMSGDYSRSDNAKAKSKSDFFARRASEGVATADHAGMVYASTKYATHSVGAIVDTANPEAVDENGSKMSDTFCLYNSFTKNDDGNICFTPRVSCKVGFLLHLEYSTEYRIRSREHLCGFDTLIGSNEERIEMALPNSYHDYREEPMQNFQYRAFVFDHTENRQYQLQATLTNGISVVVHSWAARSSLMTTPTKAITNLQLFYRDNDGESWIPYTKDWALYAGYIKEEGEIDVEMDFRLSPQDVSAGETLVLDYFRFGGAEQGMQIRLGTATSLRPFFSTVPGYGSPLEFKDIAPRNIRQVDLLSALGDMFNLAFYTDRTRKELLIEPLEELYHDGEVDWSHRIDRLSEIEISDSGIDLPQTVVLAYLNNDYATQEFNKENETTLGRWEFRNSLYGTKKSTKRLGNRLFSTTLNASNIVGSAPSASIMQVGDIGGEDDNYEVPFTPRIVCYKGMRPLPKGESWGITVRLDSYPYATFVDESTNLCFEPRNGIEGLNRYYRPMLQRQQESQLITLKLRLTTAEMATLFTADGRKPSLRTLFRFNIRGESLPFRLAKIEAWDTENNIVQCTFEEELNS